MRGRGVAYIAQSAAASFNPAMTLYDQVCEVPVRHGLMSRGEAKVEAVKLFRELDLPNPETFGERYPHQVSGGQLQRAMAAMAMAAKPDILVFDEPTTALDVTTQVEVLASFRKLIREHGTAALYITHDLAVVAQIADRIMVLRHGKMIEIGDAAQILQPPRDEYTRRLVAERVAGHNFVAQGGAEGAAAGRRPCDRQLSPSCRVIDDVSLNCGRRYAGRRRRIGLGQEHARPRHRRPAAARSGRHPLSRREPAGPAASPNQGSAAARPDDLSNAGCGAQSAPDACST